MDTSVGSLRVATGTHGRSAALARSGNLPLLTSEFPAYFGVPCELDAPLPDKVFPPLDVGGLLTPPAGSPIVFARGGAPHNCPLWKTFERIHCKCTFLALCWGRLGGSQESTCRAGSASARGAWRQGRGLLAWAVREVAAAGAPMLLLPFANRRDPLSDEIKLGNLKCCLVRWAPPIVHAD